MEDPEAAEALKKRAKTEPEKLKEKDWLIIFAAFPMQEIIKFLDFPAIFMLTKTRREIKKFFKRNDIWKNYAYTALGEDECHKYEKLVVNPGAKGINYKWFLWAYNNRKQNRYRVVFYKKNTDDTFEQCISMDSHLGLLYLEAEFSENVTKNNENAILIVQILSKLQHLLTVRNSTIGMLHNERNAFTVLYAALECKGIYVDVFSPINTYSVNYTYEQLVNFRNSNNDFLRQEIKDFYI